MEKFLNYTDNAPPILGAFIIGTLVSNRSWSNVVLFAGILISQACNMVLKRVIDHPRPEHSPIPGRGMPSAHSQFAAFFAVFLLLTSRKWSGHSGFSRISWTVIPPCIALGVGIGRVITGHHFLTQVVAGWIIGVVLAVFAHVLSSPVWNFITSHLKPIHNVLMYFGVHHNPTLGPWSHSKLESSSKSK